MKFQRYDMITARVTEHDGDYVLAADVEAMEAREQKVREVATQQAKWSQNARTQAEIQALAISQRILAILDEPESEGGK